MKTLEQIDAAIFSLQKELVELENKKRLLIDLPENKLLAILLHNKLCKHNHTDGCDWYYDCDKYQIPRFKHNTQRDYLHKADLLLNISSYKDIIKILEII